VGLIQIEPNAFPQIFDSKLPAVASTSIITTGSVERMKLKEGADVFAVMKATSVWIEKG
jgi:molybdopterin-binding protein